MLTGAESTIVTSCSAGDREPMGRAPDPANRVCTGRSVCEVLCRFLAAFQSRQLTDCSSGPVGFTVCCMWSLACPRVRQMTSSPGKCVRAAAHETLFLLHLPSFLPAMGLLRSRSQVGSAVNPRPNDATPHSSPQGPGLLHARLSSKKIKEPTPVEPSNPPCRLAGTSRTMIASHQQRSQRSQCDPSAVTALKDGKIAVHSSTSNSEILCRICHTSSGDTGLCCSAEGRHSLLNRANTAAADLLGALRPAA